MTTPPTLNDARILLAGADDLIARALARAREITDGGKRIDDHQVLSERVTYAATEGRAAQDMIARTAAALAEGGADDMLELTCVAGVADLVESLKNRLAHAIDDLGLDESVIEDPSRCGMRSGNLPRTRWPRRPSTSTAPTP
ncbi:MAG: hypothetical protein JRG90_22160 [Deltaproteobacteria bacterium]|nr:hypothetical protein [Deltaproteobacteria bacterium]